MEKLKSLDFSTPDSACYSLRILAEWVRQGEIRTIEISTILVPDAITAERILAFTDGKSRL